MTPSPVWENPVVVVVTGLPGTGKSTLADAIAASIGAPAFSGDWLMGALTPSRILVDVERSASLSVYEGLLRSLFTRQVILGQSAIVDCVVDDETIERWSGAVTELGGRLVTVECVCTDKQVHRSRVDGRVRGIPGWHEIDWNHVEFMRRELKPLHSPRLILDAVVPADVNLERALAHIESAMQTT